MKIIVRVPATTANLGPGFDCLGLALQLWNRITVEEAPDGQGLQWRDGTRDATTQLPAGATNLVLEAMQQFFTRAGIEPPRVRVTTLNAIPSSPTTP